MARKSFFNLRCIMGMAFTDLAWCTVFCTCFCDLSSSLFAPARPPIIPMGCLGGYITGTFITFSFLLSFLYLVFHYDSERRGVFKDRLRFQLPLHLLSKRTVTW
ncbi:hypothetical protein BDV96DRAFT_62342 [Lophiotrema nucula]|uniref:Uncharacterized protein n=1 Tax=Lophiotrema nucula TaxID=690887 RepID=A0A6A5ZBC0_9PLEO|nr:hypothetical protein BDV96DRAFT_62342 [Lophiotrema nucula]